MKPVLLAGALLAGLVCAPFGGASAADAPPAAAATQVQNNVTFMSGGVGEGERGKMQGIASGFNLKLVAAQKDGHYLSDVRVRILDGRGKELVNTSTDGPIFLAQLPPGRYRVEATSGDQTRTRDVEVNRRRQTVVDLRY